METEPRPLVFSIDELRGIADTLFDHLEATVGSSVEMKHDLFWAVPPEKLFDVYSQVEELTIGSLASNIDELRAIRVNSDQALSYALVWMGDLLRSIGTENVV